jgi:hypothetical protein
MPAPDSLNSSERVRGGRFTSGRTETMQRCRNHPSAMVRLIFGILISAAFLGACAPSPVATAATPPLARIGHAPAPRAANHYGDDHHKCLSLAKQHHRCRRSAD